MHLSNVRENLTSGEPDVEMIQDVQLTSAKLALTNKQGVLLAELRP